MELEKEHIGDWDAAIKGSSALRAAILSLLHDAIALYTSKDSGAILYDMAKFYDHIDIIILCTQAEDMECHPLLLALRMQRHLAL